MEADIVEGDFITSPPWPVFANCQPDLSPGRTLHAEERPRKPRYIQSPSFDRNRATAWL